MFEILISVFDAINRSLLVGKQEGWYGVTSAVRTRTTNFIIVNINCNSEHLNLKILGLELVTVKLK